MWLEYESKHVEILENTAQMMTCPIVGVVVTCINVHDHL